MRKTLYPGVCVAALLASSIAGMGARQAAGNAVAIDADDIGGVVTSTKGPEAGVWVIAETKELPTGFSRIVVTDDRGRYVVPDLPKATTRFLSEAMASSTRRGSRPRPASR
jgi:hypothetical protein